MMKHKIFKVIAIMCSFGAVFGISTLDSPTIASMIISIVCLSYLAIYATVKGCEIDGMDNDR